MDQTPLPVDQTSAIHAADQRRTLHQQTSFPACNKPAKTPAGAKNRMPPSVIERRTLRWLTADRDIAAPMFWILLALLPVAVIATGPVLTSDGPAHLSMAHFIAHAGDPAWPMLNRLYEVNLTLSPNALGDLFLAGMMLFVPPLAAEQIVQILCLVSVPLAALLALRRLGRETTWLALFFFPVALQRMFFLGLYNYCLSLSGFLLCIWAYLRLRASFSIGDHVLLAAFLVVTLACQAAGWMEAMLALGVMTLAEVAVRWRAGEPAWPLMRLPSAMMLSCTPGLMLFAVYVLWGSGDRHVVYGVSALARLRSVFVGDPFAPIGQTTTIVSLVMGWTLLGLAATGFFARAPSNPLRLGTCLLPVVFVSFLLVIPDEAGGGWTHTWRAQVFPYVGLVLACATWRSVPCRGTLPPRWRV